MQKYALILAGGQGVRMQSTIPKQFLEIDGKAIIIHTIEKFIEYDPSIQLVIILPIDHIKYWENLKKSFLTNHSIILTTGGVTRSQSVRAGLKKIANYGLVAIHDAVRPFVSIKTISDSFKSAEEHGSGVATVELIDSIREVVINRSVARNRNNFRLIQTPQTFQIKKIKSAYEKIISNKHSDDASLYEAAGFEVNMIEGTQNNIKITIPEDIQ